MKKKIDGYSWIKMKVGNALQFSSGTSHFFNCKKVNVVSGSITKASTELKIDIMLRCQEIFRVV